MTNRELAQRYERVAWEWLETGKGGFLYPGEAMKAAREYYPFSDQEAFREREREFWRRVAEKK